MHNLKGLVLKPGGPVFGLRWTSRLAGIPGATAEPQDSRNRSWKLVLEVGGRKLDVGKLVMGVGMASVSAAPLGAAREDDRDAQIAPGSENRAGAMNLRLQRRSGFSPPRKWPNGMRKAPRVCDSWYLNTADSEFAFCAFCAFFHLG